MNTPASASNRLCLLATVLLLVVWQLSGCAFTTMQTPQQLDANETAVSASLDVPGGLDSYEPYFTWSESRLGTSRLGIQAMYGIADHGDAGIHAGATLNTFNLGISGRYYIDDWLTAGVQTDYMFALDLVTIAPRLLTATDDERWYYGGIQSHLFFGVADDEPFMNPLGGTIGFAGGVEYVVDDWAVPVGFQAEATLSPFYFGHGTGLFILDRTTAGLYQIGAGINVRF